MLGIYMTKKYLKAYRIALAINFLLIVGLVTFWARTQTFGEVMKIALSVFIVSFFMLWMPSLIYALFLRSLHPAEKENQLRDLIEEIKLDSAGKLD